MLVVRENDPDLAVPLHFSLTVFLSVVSGLKQKPQTVWLCASKTTDRAGGCLATMAFSSIDWVANKPWPLPGVSRRSVRHFFFSFCFCRWRRFLSLQPLALELGRVVFVEVEGRRGVDERGHGSASTAFGSLQGSLQASIF